METPSNTAVSKITENSESALDDTEVMSAASNSIRDWDDISSDIHLESIYSPMQSLVKEGSVHSMITIASTDKKTIQDEQNDQDDQEDQTGQEGQENQEDQGNPENQEDQGDQGDQEGQETEMKKQKAIMKRHEYICVIISTFIFMIIPFIWYHLGREEKGDVILPGQTYNQDDNMKSNDSCPFLHIVGDNYCDDEANILECGYDWNDCCKVDRDISLCTDCFCYIPEYNKIMLEEQFNTLKECTNELIPTAWTTYFGDGLCDLGFNNKEHFFDIGDCCQEDPTCMSSTFVSTARDEFCPENVCIESNIFCVEEELGDGICQGYNNGPLCDHDLGDCCLVTGSQTNFTCNSECFLDAYYQISYFLG